MKVMWAIMFYVLQPLLWLGILMTYMNYKKRIKNERKWFTSSIYIDFFEGRHFLRSALILGLIGSLVGLILGMVLPIKFILVYELIMVILLLMRQSLSIVGVCLSVAALFFTKNLGFWGSINNVLSDKGINERFFNFDNANFLIFFTLLIFLTGIFIKQNAGKFTSPEITYNQRRKRIAYYQFNELSIVPIFTLVPGDWFINHLAFWPVFDVNHHHYAFLFFPVLIGFKWTVKHAIPSKLFKSLSRGIMQTGLIGIVGIIGSYFYPIISIWAILIMLINYLRIIISNKHTDNKTDFDYSQVINGVRIIAIQPHTPASKMNLLIGDVILEVNHIKINNEDDLYRALSTNSTYCYLKVIDRNNQLKVTETAIFKDSPSELGIETFAEKD